jgi:type II secretory pathway pseudopilin PulG
VDYQQIVTAAIAIVAVIISLVSLSRYGAVQRQQLRLQRKQEELTTLQLDMLQKQAAAAASPPAEKADVRVELQQVGRDYKFLITNWGSVPARNITLVLTPEAGRHSPLVQGDYDRKLPVKELAPGGRVTLLAFITGDTGITFDGEWTWLNPDGSEAKRSSLLAI